MWHDENWTHEIFLTMNKKVMFFYSLEASRDKNISPRTNFTWKYQTVNFLQTTVISISTSMIVWVVSLLCYICNMSRRDLPDMYAWAWGHAMSEGKCGHIRQILIPHVTYVMYHSQHSKNLPNPPFTVLPLYIITDAIHGYGFLILTFLWCLLRYIV